MFPTTFKDIFVGWESTLAQVWEIWYPPEIVNCIIFFVAWELQVLYPKAHGCLTLIS